MSEQEITQEQQDWLVKVINRSVLLQKVAYQFIVQTQENLRHYPTRSPEPDNRPHLHDHATLPIDANNLLLSTPRRTSRTATSPSTGTGVDEDVDTATNILVTPPSSDADSPTTVYSSHTSSRSTLGPTTAGLSDHPRPRCSSSHEGTAYPTPVSSFTQSGSQPDMHSDLARSFTSSSGQNLVAGRTPRAANTPLAKGSCLDFSLLPLTYLTCFFNLICRIETRDRHRPYECRMCGRRYGASRTVRAHYREKHAETVIRHFEANPPHQANSMHLAYPMEQAHTGDTTSRQNTMKRKYPTSQVDEEDLVGRKSKVRRTQHPKEKGEGGGERVVYYDNKDNDKNGNKNSNRNREERSGLEKRMERRVVWNRFVKRVEA